MEEEPKKNGWGGKREGAGRPKGTSKAEPSKLMRVRQSTAEKLEDFADDRDLTLIDAMDFLLRMGLRGSKS